MYSKVICTIASKLFSFVTLQRTENSVYAWEVGYIDKMEYVIEMQIAG
jgi:hypothetical protein